MSRGQLAEMLGDARPEMKVLFMSGYAEKIVLNHRIMDVGTNFLQKSFTLGSLGRKIREVLRAGRAASAASG
jgi:hypothetical protein